MANIVNPMYRVGQTTGSVITVNSTASVTTLPVDSNGTTARAVLMSCNASTGVQVRLGATTGTTTATTSDGFLVAATPLAVITRGCGAIATISAGASGLKLFISPIEDA